jgi:diphthine-ammonia ligase
VIHSDSAFATVAYLRIKSAHLVEKDMLAVPVMHFTNLPLDRAASNICEVVRDLDIGTWTPPRLIGDYIDTNIGAEEHPVLPFVVRRGQWVAVTSVRAPYTPFQSLQEEVKGCFGVVRGNYPPLTMNGCLHHHRFAFSRGLRPHSHREHKPLHL